uniref:ATP-binding protein n=1 Tax=Streptomyces chartreusis TaxID=1969 RepID=UPI003F496BDA
MVDLLTLPAGPKSVRAAAQSTSGHLVIDLDVTPRSVRPVRTMAMAQLGLWGLDGLADATELAVSELLTNVFQHTAPNRDGRRPVCITLTRVPDGVALCVHDADPNPPRALAASSKDTSGRGLQLVQALADKFGVAPSPDGGKDVWATFVQEAELGPGDANRRTASPT